MRKKLIFLAQLGAPGRYDPAIFANQPGGDDEILWFQQLLSGLGLTETLDFEGRRISYGDPLPDDGDADAYVIGGSFHSVHERLDWQKNLFAWIETHWTKAEPPPVFGICGGHQAISHIKGAEVDSVPIGKQKSTLSVQLTEAGRKSPLFDGVDPWFHFANEERVAQAPAGSTVLAEAPGMPACALDHGKGWASVQFHPEATDRVMVDSWGDRAAEMSENYVPTQESPRLILNFLKVNGVI